MQGHECDELRVFIGIYEQGNCGHQIYCHF